MARKQYHIYVIELDPAVLKTRRVKDENPDYVDGMDCLYVGQTARTPEERFEQHKEGYKSNRYTKKYGVRLRPDLYERYNPIRTREQAEEMEEKLASKLRTRGYAVWFN
jgi:hypothetical protein